MGVKKEYFEPLIAFLQKHLQVSPEDARAAERLAAAAAEEQAASEAPEAGRQGLQEAAAEDEVPEGQFPMAD
jgi:hypothetical protein